MTSGAVLRAAVRGQRRDVGVGALLAGTHQLAEAAVPVAVGLVVDRAIAPRDPGALAAGLALVVGVFAVLASSAALGYWRARRAELGAAHGVRLDLAARVLHPGGGAPGRAGELVSLAGADADRAAGITWAVVTAVSAAAALVGGGIVLLAASPVLAAVVLVGVPAVLVVTRLLARPLVARAEAEQAALAAATAVATDLVTGLRVVKGIGAERAGDARYRRTSRAALRARLAAARVEGGYTAATGVVTGLFLVVVAWVGGRLALDGAITVGELIAGVGLAQFLLGPLERLTAAGTLLAGARGSGRRVAALLAAPPAVRGGDGALPPVRGALRVPLGRDGVDVRAGTDVRGGIDVRAGEHVGVVAPHPRDAAALLDALARDSDAAVVLDGADLRAVPLDEARRAVLVARHDAVLLDGPVRDTTGADPAVLAATAADEVVATLRGGLDAELAERGRTVSGGQRQRLALARALAARAPVLVLHDPTTAVDAATEHRIAAGVTGLRAGCTTVVVASSPALLARCDRVLLVLDGAVAAAGRHADLVADPRYAAAVLG